MPMRIAVFALLLLTTSSLPLVAQSSAPPPFDSSAAPRSAEEAQAAQKAWAKFLKRKVVGQNSIGMRLAMIPPGSFLMGSPPEEERGLFTKPESELRHVVTISKPFYMGVYEVTTTEFKQVTGQEAGMDFEGVDESQFPVTWVTMEQVAEFLKALSKKEKRTYRLPTEAEWEYACRAGTHTPFWTGETIDGDQLNCHSEEPYGGGKPGPYLKRPVGVGSFQANPFGLYDVHGNAAELCSDWYDRKYYANSPVRDPPGPEKPQEDAEHLARGGGFHAGVDMQRSAKRWGAHADGRADQIGFRVVMELPAAILANVPDPPAPAVASVPKQEADDPAASPPTELEGTWDVVELLADGETIPAKEIEGTQIVFQGGNMTVTAVFGKLQWTFTSDPAQQPKHIDVSEGKKKPGPGIYELDGESLKLSLSKSEPRPEDFVGRKEPKTTVFILQRAKE